MKTFKEHLVSQETKDCFLHLFEQMYDAGVDVTTYVEDFYNNNLPIAKPVLPIARRVKDHDISNAFQVISNYSKVISNAKHDPISKNYELIRSIHHFLGTLKQLQNESVIKAIVKECAKNDIDPELVIDFIFNENLTEGFSDWWGGIKHGIKNAFQGWNKGNESYEKEKIQKWTDSAIQALQRLQSNPLYQRAGFEKFTTRLNDVYYKLTGQAQQIPEQQPQQQQPQQQQPQQQQQLVNRRQSNWSNDPDFIMNQMKNDPNRKSFMNKYKIDDN